ncbi:SusC/RagA family TonB-linked outer membrane protein, partial [Zobellia galactanivorans]|nr:SusC/RagA family TonB-linked outer membrane protein [Zobellia galactanivorans]
VYPNLELKTNLGYSDYSLASYRLLPSSARNPILNLTPETYSSNTSNSSKRHSWIIEPQLHWNKQWDRVNVSVLTGSTFQQQTTNTLVQKGIGFPNNNLLLNFS